MKRRMRKITYGFTLIEILISVVLTSTFLAIFIQLSLPIQDRMTEQAKIFERYQQLQFVTAFLDDAVRISDSVMISNSIDAENSGEVASSTIISFSKIIEQMGVTAEPQSFIFLSCFVDLNRYFSCSSNKHEGENKSTHLPLLKLADYGAENLEILRTEAENHKSIQFRLMIGTYILQFGFMPHVYFASQSDLLSSTSSTPTSATPI